MTTEHDTSVMADIGELVGNAQLGDSQAESEIHKQFVARLVNLASLNISRRFRSKLDPEDIVQSVFGSFFRRHRRGEFSIQAWNDLWALLVRITLRKCVNHANSLLTAKRNVAKEFRMGDSANSDWFDLGSSDPTPEEVAIFNETMDCLFDRIPDDLQATVLMRLDGMSNYDISEELGCSLRTVTRHIEKIKKILLAFEIE